MEKLTLSIKAKVKKKKISVRLVADGPCQEAPRDHTWEESQTLTSCNSAPRLALLSLLTALMSSPCCVLFLSSTPSHETSQPWRTAAAVDDM